MGYRSVIITQHTGVTIPQWFAYKWGALFSVPTYDARFSMEKYAGKPRTPIASLSESKGHEEIIEDLKKVVAEDTEWTGDHLKMIVMHEDGKVNRLNIYADKVVIEAPTGWEVVEDVYNY
jgi:hypothetical protein